LSYKKNILILYKIKMNSLDKRVKRIESVINEEQEIDLITKLKNKQNKKKSELMNELTSKYLEYLESQSLSQNVNINLIEVLWFTIKYVETNKINIGRLLGVSVNDESFDDVVVHLIEINVPDISEEFIVKGIKFLQSLQMKQEEIVDVISSKPKKSFFGKN